jgi:hypothetical protein
MTGAVLLAMQRGCYLANCHLVANPVLTVAANQKNLLLGWRYWLVGVASEPLRLRVAGGRRWPAY